MIGTMIVMMMSDDGCGLGSKQDARLVPKSCGLVSLSAPTASNAGDGLCAVAIQYVQLIERSTEMRPDRLDCENQQDMSDVRVTAACLAGSSAMIMVYDNEDEDCCCQRRRDAHRSGWCGMSHRSECAARVNRVVRAMSDVPEGVLHRLDRRMTMMLVSCAMNCVETKLMD